MSMNISLGSVQTRPLFVQDTSGKRHNANNILSFEEKNRDANGNRIYHCTDQTQVFGYGYDIDHTEARKLMDIRA